MKFIDPNNLEPEQLLQYRRTLAKRLNERARALEKRGVTWGFIERYNLAVMDYGKKRLPENEKAISGLSTLSEVLRLQDLLEMETSTIIGIHRVNLRRQKTLKEKYGITFESAEQMARFFENEGYRALADLYGSGTALNIVAGLEASPDEVADAVEAAVAQGDPAVLGKYGIKSVADILRLGAKGRGGKR